MRPLHRKFRHLFSAVVVAIAVLISVGHADARRAAGGGFGSRGSRTFQSPPSTATAPTPAAPIQRTMTPAPPSNQAAPALAKGTTPRPGFFGGLSGSLIGGLLLGGVVGAFMGTGVGGGIGILNMVLQIGLVVGAAMLLLRFLRKRQRQPYAASGFAPQAPYLRAETVGSSTSGALGSGKVSPIDEIGITQNDLHTFDELLSEIQSAYSDEDYAKLREITTPEAMSYLAEEIGKNASRGVRNKVSVVQLLQGDLAEAWREDQTEYATLAMKYSSVDATVDRESGKIIAGDAKNATEATEVWTFARIGGKQWKLSAIQAT
jgi:predicted lipid-binding transport protein (Tim44 family)